MCRQRQRRSKEQEMVRELLVLSCTLVQPFFFFLQERTSAWRLTRAEAAALCRDRMGHQVCTAWAPAVQLASEGAQRLCTTAAPKLQQMAHHRPVPGSHRKRASPALAANRQTSNLPTRLLREPPSQSPPAAAAAPSPPCTCTRRFSRFPASQPARCTAATAAVPAIS